MAIDTKPNFSSNKFEQCATDIMNLSGCTQIFGTFDMESGSTFTICDNVGNGKVLTSNASGVASWQTPSAQGITAISGGSGMDFSPITSAGSIVLGTPSSITNSGTTVSSGTTHDHALLGQCFVTGTQGILVDGNNRFYLDETYITDATLPNLYGYSGITANQSIGALPSGQTLGMVYITNTGSTTGYFNLGTSPTGDDITPYQTIQVDPNEDVSVTINMRLSLTANTTIYVSSDDWTNVGINLQWANITYQNASTTINPGDLPVASETTLGAVIIGSGLSVDGSGNLCATGAVSGATNLGSGLGQIFSGEVNDELRFKTISGGTNITITTDANYVGISSTGGGAGSAANGLCVCGDYITLGGVLTGTTHVDLNTNAIRIMDTALNNGLSVCPTQIYAALQAGDKVVSLEPTCVDLYSATGAEYVAISLKDSGALSFDYTTTAIITDSSGDGYGLQYAGAYKNTFKCHSLVDVDYVTGLTSGGSGGFLGLVTKATTEPTDLQENQWVKPEPMSTDCFNYTFDNFLDSGSTAISLNLSLEDVYLRYCSTGTSAGYWIKEGYEKPLSSGYTWVGGDTCKATEVAVINEWVNTPAEVCYVGQKYAYQTQTIFQVDVGTCATIPNKILVSGITLSSVGNTCIFTIPAGMCGLINSAKLIMSNDATPDSITISIGNNSSTYNNMLSACTIDDVLTCEVYELMPTSLPSCAASQTSGSDVYFRVNTAATGGTLNANLLVEGYVY